MREWSAVVYSIPISGKSRIRFASPYLGSYIYLDSIENTMWLFCRYVFYEYHRNKLISICSKTFDDKLLHKECLSKLNPL